ncbi:uncharacterized protein LOC111693783 [Trichogramma pretiosum]|uniref:uncharacterized protein LOC111693783 n=1 Tax=Trichogramma pretiosum TaxID=7493 RepID=UPI000C71B09B|nr:uncharacterized protein LOC111693783 [Trichogramma pretiosum]
MESSDLINCAVRVKEEPSDVPISENDSEMIDEKPDLKNIQLLPHPPENSIPTVRKCEGNHDIVCDDKLKIVFECQDVKPNINLSADQKIEDDSRDIEYSDGCKTQNKINIDPAVVVKQEIVGDAAEGSNLNFNPIIVEQNEKRRITKKLNEEHDLKKYMV